MSSGDWLHFISTLCKVSTSTPYAKVSCKQNCKNHSFDNSTKFVAPLILQIFLWSSYVTLSVSLFTVSSQIKWLTRTDIFHFKTSKIIVHQVSKSFRIQKNCLGLIRNLFTFPVSSSEIQLKGAKFFKAFRVRKKITITHFHKPHVTSSLRAVCLT